MLGSRIKQGRLAAGMSLRELAQGVGLSAMAISKYERDQIKPSSETLLRLTKALGVRTEYFFRQPSIELTEVDFRKHAKVLDIGSAEAGQKYNSIDRIHCPMHPASEMLRMVDPKQPHIWFESCPICQGRFYDAGEYRDFAEFTLGDLIKRFTAPARD